MLYATYAGREEELDALVEQLLVRVVSETERLQELVRKAHHLEHTQVFFLHA